MSFSLFPKSVKFFDLFMEQNKKLVKAVNTLHDLFAEFRDVEEKCKRINIIESEGNKICRDISKELSSTFVTPIDREDIYDINLAQEDILNLIKAISTRIGLYGFGQIKDPAQLSIHNLKLMVEEAGVMLRKLKDGQDASQNLDKVKAWKYECDMFLLVALGETYDCEQYNFTIIMDIIKWTHIYDRIEQAIERTETLADILEGIMLKNG